MEIALNGKPYIELNKVLKITGMVESGGIAKLVIQDQMVKVNGEVETRVRKKLIAGDRVSFEGQEATIIQ